MAGQTDERQASTVPSAGHGAPAVDELTYKEASQELERIVRALESGDMELEESLESYTRGVELIKSLRTRLATAEQQVKILVQGIDGTDELVDGEAASVDDKLSI